MVKLANPEVIREGDCTIYYPFKAFCLAALVAEEIIQLIAPAFLFF